MLIAAVVLCLGATYTWGYYKARKDGLFVGAVETFAPYGGTPSGQYEIKPIGYLALSVHPDAYDTESGFEEALAKLRSDQERSRRLWPYYRWFAQLEELFH